MLDVRYDLALQYAKMNNADAARDQLELILEILDQNDLKDTDAYTQVTDALEQLNAATSGDGDEESTTEEQIPGEGEDIEFPQPEELDTGDIQDAGGTDDTEQPQDEGSGSGTDTGTNNN